MIFAVILSAIRSNYMKKFIKLFLVSLLCLISFLSISCGGDANSSGTGDNSQNGTTESPDHSGSDENPSDSSDSDETLWDVSDVDVSHIGKNNRLVAFTFDDGPKNETNALLDVFKKFNDANKDFEAHATMFTVGLFVTDSNSTILERAVSMKFELGNHTYSHNRLTEMSDEEVKQELKKTDDVLKRFDNKSVHLVRPAGGHADSRVLSLYDTTFINWTTSLDPSDWNPSTTENDIYNLISANVLDGGIVLLHQGYDKTVKAVERLLPDLKAKGYQVVSVAELIKHYGIKAKKGALYDSFIE